VEQTLEGTAELLHPLRLEQRVLSEYCFRSEYLHFGAVALDTPSHGECISRHHPYQMYFHNMLSQVLQEGRRATNSSMLHTNKSSSSKAVLLCV